MPKDRPVRPIASRGIVVGGSISAALIPAALVVTIAVAFVILIARC